MKPHVPSFAASRGATPPSAAGDTADGQTLDQIHVPADVRRLSRPELKQLATELREFVVQTVSQTGGHFSSNLGTVELTIALHYVFDTPHDRLVWDVGHQTYPHKMLTGRKDRMSTLRQLGGISGFPRRDESEYDTFGTAHSSTSISAALGMAVAARMKGEARQVRRRHRRRRDERRHGVRGAQQRRRLAAPTCWSSSTTTTCRSRRRSAR